MFFLKYYRNNSKIPKEKTKSWLTKVTINDCKTYWLYFWKRGTVELNENQLSDGNVSYNITAYNMSKNELLSFLENELK